MRTSRRLAVVFSGALAAVAMAAGPALATAPETIPGSSSSIGTLTTPSNGYCLPEELGHIMLGADRWLYECEYVPYLGYWWVHY
jgi:hypothetical protein